MRTLWLKNSKGETFDLMATKIELGYSSFAYNLNQFIGYNDDVQLTAVSNNFVVDSRTPQGSNLSCTMLFASHEHIRLFNEFIRDLNGLRLYYDPKGLVLPETQIKQAWYKPCAFVSIEPSTKNKNRLFECVVNFTFLTAKWQRDTILSSTLMGVQDESTQFPFYMPFWFYSSGKIGLMINNENDETSCEVSVINNTGESLAKCAWVAYYDDNTKQMAEWMAGQNKLKTGKTLVVDSTAGSEIAFIRNSDNSIEVVTREQAIGTKYENFISIKTGKNEILFDFGRIDNIEVVVTYKEQIRMGLV